MTQIKIGILTKYISRRIQSTAKPSFQEMQRYVSQIIWCKRSGETKYEAGGCREAYSNLSSKPVRNGTSKQHSDEHPAVVNRPDQCPLPFLTAEVELKDEEDLDTVQVS